MRMQNKLTVLIADDHTLVRHGVATLLAMQPDMRVIGDVATGEAAVAVAAREQPHVALVDLLMPGRLNGVMTTRAIKRVSARRKRFGRRRSRWHGVIQRSARTSAGCGRSSDRNRQRWRRPTKSPASCITY